MTTPYNQCQPTPEPVRQFDEADGHACSLRQQSTWVEESREAKVSVYERITLDDIDTDEMRAAAQFIENQAAEADSLKARAEQAERSVDVLESNARVQAKLLADTGRRVEELEAALREMIQTQDDWEIAVAKIIGRQPEIFTRAIDRARAALPQSRDVARAPT